MKTRAREKSIGNKVTKLERAVPTPEETRAPVKEELSEYERAILGGTVDWWGGGNPMYPALEQLEADLSLLSSAVEGGAGDNPKELSYAIYRLSMRVAAIRAIGGRFHPTKCEIEREHSARSLALCRKALADIETAAE